MSLQRMPFEREDSGDFAGVVTLRLTQPGRPVIVLDSAFLSALDATLDAIGDDLAGFVLASDSRVFVAGANLEEVMQLDDEALHRYLEFGSSVYERIATMPCTTVAAINGAALGGGLELAMHCDHLIAMEPQSSGDKPGKPYPIGLPEAGLNICPGWGGTVMLPARMDAARAIRQTATGRTMLVHEAAESGLVEQLARDPADLLKRARRIAASPKKSPRTEPIALSNADKREDGRTGLEQVRKELPDTGSARAVLRCVERGLAEGWRAALQEEQRSLVALRHTEEGRSAIEAFFARTRGS